MLIRKAVLLILAAVCAGTASHVGSAQVSPEPKSHFVAAGEDYLLLEPVRFVDNTTRCRGQMVIARWTAESPGGRKGREALPIR
jgi:hypothetical protein